MPLARGRRRPPAPTMHDRQHGAVATVSSRARFAGRPSNCDGTDTLSFLLPVSKPGIGCAVAIHVAPGPPTRDLATAYTSCPRSGEEVDRATFAAAPSRLHRPQGFRMSRRSEGNGSGGAGSACAASSPAAANGAIREAPNGPASEKLAASPIPRFPTCRVGSVSLYTTYIASAAWRSSPARLAELAAAQRRCRICARGDPDVRLEVHHRTYARLGRERASDLTTLCSECHLFCTDALRARRHAATRPPAPKDTWACLQRQTPITSEWINEDR